jgi:integrase
MKAMKKSSEVTRHRIRKGLAVVKRGDIWYAEECSKGVQSRRCLKTENLGEAISRAESGWTAPSEPAAAPAAEEPAPSAALTLGKAFEEYVVWYTKYRRSIERTLTAVDPFVKATGEKLDVQALTRNHVQKWVTAWTDGHAVQTVRSDFSRVRAFVRWVSRRKEIPSLLNVCSGVDQPKDEDVTREAPAVEKVRLVLRKLSESGHPWMHDYVRLLIETGARPSEILGLRGSDVRGKLVHIVPWEGRGLKSKWSKRTIEVNETAIRILEARKETMLDKARPIFATELGEMYKERSVSHLLREILAGGRQKKIPAELQVTLYDMRHFFASEHAAPGPAHMAIESLAAHLGHSPASIKVLLRWYADQNALRRGAAVSVLGEQKDGEVLEMKKKSV